MRKKNNLIKIDKRFLMLFLTLLLSINSSLCVDSINNELNLNDLPEFQFTGVVTVENYDYDKDGQGDMLIVNIEIYVTNPGIISINKLCLSNGLFWNNTFSSNEGSYTSCGLYGVGIMNKTTIGTTILSMYFGYGYLLHGINYPQNIYLDNFNFTLGIEIGSFYPNGLVGPDVLSNDFNFTMTKIQTLNLKNYDNGIINPDITFCSPEIINGLAIEELYKWEVNNYINNTFYGNGPDQFYTSFITIKFLKITSSYVNYNLTQIFDNQTSIYSYNYYMIPEKGIKPDQTLFQYFIPQNTDPEKLQNSYNIIWSFLLANSNNYDITAEFRSKSDFFTTNVSMSYNDGYNHNHNSGSYEITYHLPTGLLSNLSFISKVNSSILQQYSAVLINPDIWSTSNHSEDTTNQKITMTTSFENNISYSILPLMVYIMLRRKFKS